MNRFLLAACFIALTGCASIEQGIKDRLEGPGSSSQIITGSDAGIRTDGGITPSNVDEAVSRSKNLPEAKRSAIAADAVHVYLDINQSDKAWKLFQPLKARQSEQVTQVQYLIEIAKARFANLDGQPREATDILRHLDESNPLSLMTRPTKVRLLETKAKLYTDLGLFDEVIDARIRLGSLITDDTDRYDFNNDIIWNTLSALSDAELTLLQSTRPDGNRQTAGWLALVRAVRENNSSVRGQLNAIETWQQQWSAHPAAQRLPSELQSLASLSENSASQIAVLLPESGKLANVGKAIRDGISAAYFAQRARGVAAPTLTFYDSTRPDIGRTYQQAIDDGAEAVIGPLNKEAILELLQSTGPVVPTMVLNEIDDLTSPLENFYQFGLPVEDESRQVANRAWLDGHRRVMVLVPSSSWGNRSAQAFEQDWIERGGYILQQSRFDKPQDFSPLIEQAMGIKESDYRHREIQKIIGRRAEFEPRARSDIDMIFMLAKPEEARQLKPTLNFHYATSIPVYATSHVYNGEEDPDADRDLNGIRFTTLPWFFDTESIEKTSIQENTNASAFFERLYAFGVDAYHLQNRLAQMAYLPELKIQGASGKLSMDDRKRVKREQLWAVFDSGLPRPLAPLDSDYIE